MHQPIVSKHDVDAEGMPAGGCTTGKGIKIDWQNGPLGRDDERKEPNGAFVEGVIEAARDRIEWYQTVSGGRFACEENARALAYLTKALRQCDMRTQRREAANVEGTHAE